jgi:hypothetical protein
MGWDKYDSIGAAMFNGFSKKSKKGDSLLPRRVPPRFGVDLQNGDVKWREKKKN